MAYILIFGQKSDIFSLTYIRQDLKRLQRNGKDIIEEIGAGLKPEPEQLKSQRRTATRLNNKKAKINPDSIRFQQKVNLIALHNSPTLPELDLRFYKKPAIYNM